MCLGWIIPQRSYSFLEPLPFRASNRLFQSEMARAAFFWSCSMWLMISRACLGVTSPSSSLSISPRIRAAFLDAIPLYEVVMARCMSETPFLLLRRCPDRTSLSFSGSTLCNSAALATVHPPSVTASAARLSFARSRFGLDVGDVAPSHSGGQVE